jgi:L-asparaginase
VLLPSPSTSKNLQKVVLIPTGGTIQNSQPFITSFKAGGELNVLRPQNLYESVTVKIAKEDIDGNALPVTSTEQPYWEATLAPEDGLYLLPYMEPGHMGPKGYTSARIGASRLVKEIDRFGLNKEGRNNLLACLAQLVVREIVDPRTGNELRAGGDTFGMYELMLIANAVNSAVKENDVEACIVTQGTYSAEETACFLNYAVKTNKPVIVSGSQTRHTQIGSGGDNNLLCSVMVAIHPDAKGKGVMMVMNEMILSAREVTKSHQRSDGFVSAGGAAKALGAIDEDRVTFYFDPLRKHTFKSEVSVSGSLPWPLPRVDIVKTYVGADGIPIEALLERAVKERSGDKACPKKHGIVIEGFAYSGDPNRLQTPILEKAIAKYGIPVGLSTRGNYGRVPAFNVNTGESDLFIRCDNMMAVKARLLLTLAIEKLGLLTPYKNFETPTGEERKKLAQEIKRYQTIFDTH